MSENKKKITNFRNKIGYLEVMSDTKFKAIWKKKIKKLCDKIQKVGIFLELESLCRIFTVTKVCSSIFDFTDFVYKPDIVLGLRY